MGSKSLLLSLILISFSVFSQNNVTLSVSKNITAETDSVNIVASIENPADQDIIIDFTYTGSATKDYDYSFKLNNVPKTIESNISPRGIRIDKDGNIYVCDYDAGRVKKWGPVSYGTPLANVATPTGLYVDENNNLYVVSEFYNRVEKWTPGATEGIIVAGGNGEGSLPNQLKRPKGITVDAAGNIYIADCDNNRIQKWAPGATTGTTVAGGKGAGSANNQLNWPYDVILDKDGNLLIADAINSRIQKWVPGAVEGTTLPINLSGLTPNRLNGPHALTFDHEGNLIIADTENKRILKLAVNSTSAVTIASNGFRPQGIAMDKVGNIYISDDFYKRIIRIQQAPQIIIKAGQTTGKLTLVGIVDKLQEGDESIILTPSNIVNGILTNPDDISINILNMNIVSFSISGMEIKENSPDAVPITAKLIYKQDKDVEITFVTEGNAVENQEYNLSTHKLVIPAGSESATLLISTKDLDDNISEMKETIIIKASAITNAGAVSNTTFSLSLISDDKPNISITSGASFKENASLEITATLDNPNDRDAYVEFELTGSAKDQVDFNTRFASKQAPRIIIGDEFASRVNPRDVCVDSQGNVYVVDDIFHRVQKWTPGARLGVTVAGGNGYGYNANQFDSPASVRVDESGNIYVSDSRNNRIQKWTPGATSGITVAGGNGKGSAANQLSGPGGIHMDASGNIYIADRANHRIQKWAPGATSGVTVAGGNGNGSAANQLYFPQDVSVDKTGNIFITDQFNDRVQKWAPYALSGETLITGVLVEGVFADDAESIYISANDQVTKWPAVKPLSGEYKGVRVAGTSSWGSQVENLNFPTDVFVDKWGNIFTADYYNYRIHKMQYAPQLLIKAGETTATLTLEGVDDSIKKGNKTITYTPITVGNCILSNMAGTTVTLVDDEFTTGIFDNSTEQLSSYPNPTTGVFSIIIPGNEREVKVSIRNTTGSIIQQSTMQVPSDRKLNMNISTLQAGVYFVSVQSEDMSYVVKVVRN